MIFVMNEGTYGLTECLTADYHVLQAVVH